MTEPAGGAAAAGGGVLGAVRVFAGAYRTELVLFALSAFVLACFSGPRFLRQSAAPHFVYASKAWLDGRLDVDPADLPNLEDWACVRESAGTKVRCEGPPRPGDRWYVSFPSFPSLLMLPFVALHGWQLNDTSFGVLLGAAAIALFFGLCRQLAAAGESHRSTTDDLVLALTLGFGTLFFSCAIRGEVWFLAEILGVLLTVLYFQSSLLARHPVRAGVFWSMATLTRTPLLFTAIFFVLEAACPGPERRSQLGALLAAPRPVLRKLLAFAAGAAPLAMLAGAYNWFRFGSPAEFGHRFLYNNRVNADIDAHGLFSLAYLPRNLEAAFLKLPEVQLHPFRLGYDPHGLSLLLTMPFLLLLLVPRVRPRLHWPLWITVAATALPGFLYQNTGYMQFGFRFSLDWTPYLVLLLAVGGWSFRAAGVQLLLAAGFLVNLWGALAFRGYTELVRRTGL
ncbi:MAG TPA: hypothetical protein VK454_12275 [Myxococcaceae bacterium]|nr:hypothetical protein [Myxococcaceae bacterium]